jgi:hypothetical protein
VEMMVTCNRQAVALLYEGRGVLVSCYSTLEIAVDYGGYSNGNGVSQKGQWRHGAGSIVTKHDNIPTERRNMPISRL